MRTLVKMMLLAVLAIPMGRAFAANDTLTVNITVTLSGAAQANVDVAFADNTGGALSKNWPVSGALGSAHDAVAAGVKPQIQNNANFGVDVTASVTNPATPNWVVGAAGTTNAFQVSVFKGAVAVPLTVSGASVAFQSIGPATSSAAADTISLTLPTKVSHTSPGGDIVVTYVASPTL